MKKKLRSEKMSDKVTLKKPLLIEVGKYLRSKREAAGYSQGDVAKAAGLSSPQFISNVERGITLPSPYLMDTMMAKYNFDMEEFLELIAQLKMEYYRELFFGNKKKTAN